MKRYWALVLCAVFAMGCEDLVTMVGPTHSSEVQLADADIWVVPSFFVDGIKTREVITWTLLHPTAPATAVVRRTCSTDFEPFLWLSDPPDWSAAIATFHACGTPGEFYSTVELAYDGTQWIGVSATGAATLLPPQ